MNAGTSTITAWNWRHRLGLAAAIVLPLCVWAASATHDASVVRHWSDPAAKFLLAAAVIILFSHGLAMALRPLGQPTVVGEILGGLLLAPAVGGALWPEGRAWLFTPEVTTQIQQAAQLGLVTFMFLLGCELRSEDVKSRRRAVFWVVGGGTLPAFLLGAALVWPGYHMMAGPGASRLAYCMFFGLALAITGLPVLARILVELGLDDKPVGGLTLTCAAVGDGLAWCALTCLIAVNGAKGEEALLTIAATVALVLVTWFLLRPGLRSLVERPYRQGGSEQILLPLLIAGALGYSAVTQLMGLHPVIGAFLFGVAVPRNAPVIAAFTRQMQGFAVTILLPLFFTGVTMSAAPGLLFVSPGHWLLTIAVVTLAFACKLIGAGGGARAAGLVAYESQQIGILMNCRGVTELVVASVGRDLRLINDFGLTVLIVMTLLTTGVTGPLMRRLSGDQPPEQMRHEAHDQLRHHVRGPEIPA